MDVYLLVAVLLDSAELRDACHQLVHRGIDGRIGSLSRAAARPDERSRTTRTHDRRLRGRGSILKIKNLVVLRVCRVK